MIPGFVRGATRRSSRFGSGRVTGASSSSRPVGAGRRRLPRSIRTCIGLDAVDRTDAQLPRVGRRAPPSWASPRRAREIYLKDDGSVYGIGERLVQRDYARTLQRIAEQWPRRVLRGRDGRPHRRRLPAQRRALHATTWRLPRRRPRAARRRPSATSTCSPKAAPTVGPVTVEILNVLEGCDLQALGWNSPALPRVAGPGDAPRLPRPAWSCSAIRTSSTSRSSGCCRRSTPPISAGNSSDGALAPSRCRRRSPPRRRRTRASWTSTATPRRSPTRSASRRASSRQGSGSSTTATWSCSTPCRDGGTRSPRASDRSPAAGRSCSCATASRGC